MITRKLNLKDVPLSALIPYVRNPRINDPAVPGVITSLKTYGFVKNSVIIDEDMILICGHTTMKAMQALEWDTVPDVTQVFGLTDAEKRAYRLADNKLGEKAQWDFELLELEFEDLNELDFNIELTGFSTKELDWVNPEIPESEPEYDESVADSVKTAICPECGHEFPV